MLAEALREVRRELSALKGELRARPSLDEDRLREVVRVEVNRLMLERDFGGEAMALKEQVARIAEELKLVSKALDALVQRVAELEGRLSAVEQRMAAVPTVREVRSVEEVREIGVPRVKVKIAENMTMDELADRGILEREAIGDRIYYTVPPRSRLPLGPENIATIDKIAQRERCTRTRHPVNRRIAWARSVRPGEAV